MEKPNSTPHPPPAAGPLSSYFCRRANYRFNPSLMETAPTPSIFIYILISAIDHNETYKLRQCKLKERGSWIHNGFYTQQKSNENKHASCFSPLHLMKTKQLTLLSMLQAAIKILVARVCGSASLCLNLMGFQSHILSSKEMFKTSSSLQLEMTLPWLKTTHSLPPSQSIIQRSDIWCLNRRLHMKRCQWTTDFL